MQVLRLLTPHFSPTHLCCRPFSVQWRRQKTLPVRRIITCNDALASGIAACEGLKTITRTTIQFIHACMEIGIDGIFYAIQHAQSSLLSETEFEMFCRPYDLEILAQCKNLWLNMVHIHGEDIYFSKWPNIQSRYLNWHDRQTFSRISGGEKAIPMELFVVA